MKKTCFQIISCRICKLRKRSHLSNVTFQWDHLSCFPCYLNQEKAKKSIFFISETLTKRSIIESIIFSTKRQVLKSNSIIILVFSSQLDQLINVVSLFSIFSTTKVNTSNIELTSSISIFNVIKRHFELRYRLDFFDSLDLLIMKCMKNVIDSQQALKWRSYKKTMNDSSRKNWIKIMKNENNFFWSTKSEHWSILLKIDKYFATNEFTKSKEQKHDEILRYKTR
jgi:hypothetical protein